MKIIVRSILLSLLLSATISVLAQRPSAINQTDANGRKTGYWEARHTNGTIRYTGNFHNDKPIGEFRYYYEDGTLRATNVFSNNGLKAIHTAYSPQGKRLAEGFYFDQKKDSTWRFYSDTDGVLVSIESYRNDKAHGESLIFYPGTEQIAEIVHFSNGQRNGAWLKYYENGNILTEGSFQNDQLHGPITFYHLDGKIHIKGQYQEGLKSGIWQTFDEDGKLTEQENYQERGF